jgi:hypothetical protein
VSVEGDVNNVYVLTSGGISGQVNIGGELPGVFQLLHACEEPPAGPAVVIGHLSGELIFGDRLLPEDLETTLHIQVGDIGADGVVEVTGSIAETGVLKITGDPNDPNVPGTVNGSVTIDEDLAGDFRIDGTVAQDGLVEVMGDVRGVPTVAGHMELSQLDGTVHVAGYVGAGGAIVVSGATSGTIEVDSHLHGYVHLQSLSGLVYVDGYMGDPNAPDSSFPGHIRIYGGLLGTAKVWVQSRYPSGGLMGPTSYVCVDYDGFSAGDDWSATASVVFGSNEDYVFHGNTPSARVWHTSRCHGDVDNSRNDRTNPYYPDFSDINPFVLAMSNPVQFSLTYPGLADTDGTAYTGGGVVYKADCNCDGSVNFGDINPFVALVGGHCDPNCPDCEGGDGPMGGDGAMGLDEPLTPEEMAAQLAANVAPELYDNLLFVVAGAIEAAEDDETQAYWQAVYDALTQ